MCITMPSGNARDGLSLQPKDRRLRLELISPHLIDLDGDRQATRLSKVTSDWPSVTDARSR